MKKQFYKSRTFLLNAALIILSIYELLTGNLLTAFGIPVEYHLRIMEIGAFVVALINIFLRKNGSQPITFKKQ